jgi:hypothetical protein
MLAGLAKDFTGTTAGKLIHIITEYILIEALET